jgi:hypothetical protein
MLLEGTHLIENDCYKLVSRRLNCGNMGLVICHQTLGIRTSDIVISAYTNEM